MTCYLPGKRTHESDWAGEKFVDKDCSMIPDAIRSQPYTPARNDGDFQSKQDIKELFRKEIAKWKDENPLFIAYVYGQEAGKKDEQDKVLDELEKIPTYPSDLGDMVLLSEVEILLRSKYAGEQG